MKADVPTPSLQIPESFREIGLEQLLDEVFGISDFRWPYPEMEEGNEILSSTMFL